MDYAKMLETRFNKFIKRHNIVGATKCVEQMFSVKPHVALAVAELFYQGAINLVDAVDLIIEKDFKEGKI